LMGSGNLRQLGDIRAGNLFSAKKNKKMQSTTPNRPKLSV